MAAKSPEAQRFATFLVMTTSVPVMVMVMSMTAGFDLLLTFSILPVATGSVFIALGFAEYTKGKKARMWKRLSLAFWLIALGLIMILTWLSIGSEDFFTTMLQEALGAVLPILVTLVAIIGVAIFATVKASRADEPRLHAPGPQRPGTHHTYQPPQQYSGSAWQNTDHDGGPFRS